MQRRCRCDEISSSAELYPGSAMRTGSPASSWSRLPGVLDLDASHNRLAGQLPDSWAEGFQNLTSLKLDGNLLGPLPEGIWGVTSIVLGCGILCMQKQKTEIQQCSPHSS